MNLQTNLDFENLWNKVKEDLMDIFKKSKKPTMTQFSRMHSFIFDYSNGTKTYLGLCKLYEHFREFFKQFLEELLEGSENLIKNHGVLKFYVDAWKCYQSSVNTIRRIGKCLNRCFEDMIDKQFSKTIENVDIIYEMGIFIWKEYIFDKLNDQLLLIVLDLIERDRKNEEIDSHLISGYLGSYKEFNNIDELVVCLDVDVAGEKMKFNNENIFQEKLLIETNNYYQQECSKFVRDNSAIDYIRFVHQRLEDEEERIQKYLTESLKIPLMTCCAKVMIRGKLNLLYNEFKDLLDTHSIEDLARFYSIHVRVSSLGNLLRIFKVYLQSFYVIQNATSEFDYAQIIVEAYFKMKTIIVTAFNNDINFSKVLNQFIEIINEKELLSKYSDIAWNKSEGSFSNMLERLEINLNDDTFLKFNEKTLGIRLFQHSSTSEYTVRVQTIYQDWYHSRNLNKKFRNSTPSRNNFDFSVQVLNSKNWPFSEFSVLPLPRELSEAFDEFNTFYRRMQKKRKLNLLYSKSKGELVTNCFKEHYTLEANTFQMTVLLQYNSRLSYTVQQLTVLTNFKEETLYEVLQQLLLSKILVCRDRDDGNALIRESEFILNDGYQNDKLTVNIDAPLKSDIKAKVARRNNYENNHNDAILAAIVRIMKKQRTLSHTQLVSEVHEHFKPIFKPTKCAIEKSIESVIKQEYLEVQDSLYHYML